MPENNSLNEQPVSDEQYDAYFREAEKSDDTESVEKVEVQQEASQEAQSEPAKTAKKDDTATELSNLKNALREERQRRKQINSQFNELKEKHQITEEKLNSVVSKMTEEERAAADRELKALREKNPSAFTEKKIQKLEDKVKDYDERFTKADQQNQQMQQRTELFNKHLSMAQEFSKDHPDFYDACQFLSDQWTNELQMMGFSPNQIAQQLDAIELSIANNALQQGKAPAEFLYDIAKSRGYKNGAGNNGASSQHTDSKFEAVAKGNQYQSLSNTAGSAPNTGIGAEQLANLEDEEFDKYFDKIMRST